MTAQTFVDSDFTTFYVEDFNSVTVGEREILVPACSSSAGDTLLMILYKQKLVGGGGRDQTGADYGVNEPGDGWDYVVASPVGNAAAGDEVRMWSKESDGAQGNVLLEWPTPDYRSSQVIFAAMLSYSAADGYVNTNFPDPGYEWVGTAQLETKRTTEINTDMSFDAMSIPCTLDATLTYFFYAKNGAHIDEMSSMVNAVDIDAALNERIRWQVPVPDGGNSIPEAREVVIADELNVDLVMPARTNTQVVTEPDLDSEGNPIDSVTWYARRQGIYGIPDESGDCGERAAYWDTLIDLA